MKPSTAAACLILAASFAGGAAAEPTTARAPPPPVSTDCETEQVPGTATVGKGPRGCHFRLYNPLTHEVRANTPYSLKLYPPYDDEYEKIPPPALEYEGVTDAQGRTAFVRTAFAIEQPYQVYFVEKIGRGPHKWAARIGRGTDSKPIPGVYYKVEWCDGPPYAGKTDEQGNGVEFHTATPNCKIYPKFYYDQWHSEIQSYLVPERESK